LSIDGKVGLVFSGGGARAAYEVGVLKAINDGRCPAAKNENPAEVFCGTGAGAFNAAVIASRFPGQYPGPADYLVSLWADEIPREGRARNNRVYRKRVDTLQFFDIPYMWRRPLKSWVQYFADVGHVAPELARRTWKAVVNRNFSAWLNLAIWHDTSPMFRLISESISLETIRDGERGRPQRALRVVATERGSGKARVFANADFTEEAGHAVVLASCALPILFPTVGIQGREYMYGGLVMQTPLQPAISAGCSVIHLIHNEPRIDKPLEQEESSTREMLNHTIAVALAATLERDLESRRRVNEAMEALDRLRRDTGRDASAYLSPDAGYRRVTVHQYRPRRVLGGKSGLLDFSCKSIEVSIADGERDAMRHDCDESGCVL